MSLLCRLKRLSGKPLRLQGVQGGRGREGSSAGKRAGVEYQRGGVGGDGGGGRSQQRGKSCSGCAGIDYVGDGHGGGRGRHSIRDLIATVDCSLGLLMLLLSHYPVALNLVRGHKTGLKKIWSSKIPQAFPGSIRVSGVPMRTGINYPPVILRRCADLDPASASWLTCTWVI